MKRSTNLKVVAAAAAVLAVGTVIPGAAQAINWADCPSDGYLCIWSNTNLNGTRSSFFYDNTSWGSSSVGDNNDESWMNDGSQYVRVYDYHSYAGGVKLCLDPDQYVLSSTFAANDGESNKWSSSIAC